MIKDIIQVAGYDEATKVLAKPATNAGTPPH
jgi:hypothetical protein